MRVDVKIFLKKCRICQHAKGKIQNTSLYQPLPIANRPSDFMSMDFILGLPKTQRGNDSVLFGVEFFSKMDHFIPCFKTSDATHVGNLFFKDVVRFHGLPKRRVSYRDPGFVGNFYRNLWKNL